MKVIVKTLKKMPKHTRGKPGAGMYMYLYIYMLYHYVAISQPYLPAVFHAAKVTSQQIAGDDIHMVIL